jgi:SAM-dependent methyltransferase
MAVDGDKLHAFVNKAIGDIGATLTAGLVVVGERLGLYRALAAGGPMTPAELATKTGTVERYVREWCAAQAAAEYIAYDASSGRYRLTPEQAVALTDDESPFCVLGGYIGMTSALGVVPKLIERFRSGKGIGWDEHAPGLFEGTERFFRPGYAAFLVGSWIPALEGVKEKLERGARVADVGCGHGASTIVMAKAFPKSTFSGFDYHAPSIEVARQRAKDAGLADRVRFERAAAKEFPGSGYDLVTFFDCLHDMGDPVGAARHVLGTLGPDGTWLLVEPFASDRLEENLNPIGRLFYSASTFVCTPASLAQEVGLALGAQAGEKRLREVLTEAGFTRIRRATETPVNLVLEVRP